MATSIRGNRGALRLLFATFLLAAVAAPATAQSNARAEALLAQLPFSAAEQRRILSGELVTTTSREQTSNRELAITMAFVIRRPPADLASQFERATAYDSEENVTAHGEIRGDGSIADLQGLRLEPNGDAEARRFASASGGTDLNLSTAEIAAFNALSDQSRTGIEAELPRMLLARFQVYRAQGLAGIAPYDRGRGRTSSPAEELTQATGASPVLASEAPEVVAALLNFPRSQPANATQRFFWVNFEVDRRPTIALTHRLIARQNDGTYVFVDRHYYVSRSHNSVQTVAGVFPVQEGALILFGTRTTTDQLGGFGANTKQAIGRRIMGGQLAALYERIRSQAK